MENPGPIIAIPIALIGPSFLCCTGNFPRFVAINSQMDKEMYVYIMANRYNSVLYIGVTNNLENRVTEHKTGFTQGFTKNYNATKLVYYEGYYDPMAAIDREKQVKGWSRSKKVKLIETMNKGWRDLFLEL